MPGHTGLVNDGAATTVEGDILTQAFIFPTTV